ncbi:MAG: hypothetical protein JO079_00430 [Frankiaceae bacterium]|nr:hypothetical protein [Frankiaceae bacterium]
MTPQDHDRLWELALNHARLAQVVEQLERDVDDYSRRLEVLEAIPRQRARARGQWRSDISANLIAGVTASALTALAVWLAQHVHFP